MHSTTRPALGLGTVQFGLPYGVSNTTGQTPISEAKEILREAWISDVRHLDTARAYGSSEHVLGQCIGPELKFHIITKLPPLPHNVLGKAQIASWTRTQVLASLKTLRCEALHGVLIHNPADAVGSNSEAIFSTLAECKAEGLINKYGSSIYDREQIDKIVSNHSVDMLQIPVNIFDQRLLEEAFLEDLRALGIELHARSVFLQGLLLMSPEQLPKYFEPIKPLVEKLHSLATSSDLSPIELALGFVQTLPLDVILVGVNSRPQLSEIVTAYNKVQDVSSSIDFSGFSVTDARYVNPSLWQLDNR